MHTKITVVSTTVETEVDAERNGRPSWILGATIKAYLYIIITISEYQARKVKELDICLNWKFLPYWRGLI